MKISANPDAMSFIKVSNVSHLVTEENLRELFQCCGEMKFLKIPSEGGKRCACIEFAEGHSAETAHMLHGTELGDQKLQVENLNAKDGRALLEDDSKATRSLTEYEKACALMESMMKGPSGTQEARNDEVKRTVYVGNLSKHCTPQHIRDEFSQIGEVVYIKFSGNADFRYAFVEFATEQQARMSFTYHGKVIAGKAIKIGTAHNPVFKDDIHIDSSMNDAKHALRRVQRKHKSQQNLGGGRRRRRRSRSRDRGGRDKDKGDRRRRRRRRDRSRSEDDDDEEEPKMFWDGYQWHFNDTQAEDIEEHVTSIIRSDVDKRVSEVDTKKKMENAAADALQTLKTIRGFQ